MPKDAATRDGRLMVALLCGGVRGALAQATGIDRRRRHRRQRRVMPGVTVTVTNAATNQIRTAVTGSDGYYSVLLLPPGKFQVKATLAGFKTITRDDITVQVESRHRASTSSSASAASRKTSPSRPIRCRWSKPPARRSAL